MTDSGTETYIIDTVSLFDEYIEDFYDRKYSINQDKEPEVMYTQPVESKLGEVCFYGTPIASESLL